MNSSSRFVRLQEVLRLYPSVPENQKYALNDDIWPDGTVVKKNDYIMWSPWAMGRTAKIWGDDAKQFKPERWISEKGEVLRETPGKWPAFHAGRKWLILELNQKANLSLSLFSL
jgi:cytochrome P450